MVSYVNVHAMVESRREAAAASGGAGPRVLVAGPVDAGKSSLARILLAYGVRMGRKPLYVDLDVGQGDISVPGTIGAAQLDASCIDVEEGFSFAIPLIYWYGSASMSTNKTLFKTLVTKLSTTIKKRFENNTEGERVFILCVSRWV
jgi:polyribonucleotide 5'-hydroxyl-kinase